VPAKYKNTAAQYKRAAQVALAAMAHASDAAFSELKVMYRAVDAAHTVALWARLRELFDYPVFVAAPKAVGITSTGDTGEGVINNLADILQQFREFERWLGKDAPAQEQPNFPGPSTA
jgi:type I restriction enzyme M protein